MSLTQPNPSSSSRRRSWPSKALDRCIIKFFNFTVSTLAASAQYLPSMRRRIKKIQIIKNIPFGPHKDHTLDIYAPRGVKLPDLNDLKVLWRDLKLDEVDHLSSHQEPHVHGSIKRGQAHGDPESNARYPFALYLHGGGFVTCSKDSHWTFGVRLAEAGLVTFLVNYRLSIDAPCPAALEDCARSLSWLLDHADRLNIDLDQGMITGESAGGNLTLGLLLCLLRCDSSPWARALFDREWVPRMIAPACAFLDVSSAGRLPDEMNRFFLWRVQALGHRYLAESDRPDLGEPLSELTRDVELARPCPPVFIPIGDNDPVYRDSILLAEELDRRQIPHRLVIYPRGVHAFHAAINMSLAERCWRDHVSYWRECGGELYEEASASHPELPPDHQES